jgi:hypothetical protein
MSPPLRTLPIALPPVHQETIGSYLNRLADANRLKLSTLAALLGLSRRWRRDHDEAGEWTDQTIARLGTLTGRTSASLIRALPALRDQVTPDRQPSTTTVGTSCRRCVARLGIRGLVIRRVSSHERVCPRHQRWLGGPHQHSLHHLPEMVHANQRHRRLARHAGPEVHEVYQHALDQTNDWFHTGHPELRRRWTQRLDRLGDDPYLDPYHPSRDRIEFASYPETVVLTSVVTSPHWRLRPDRHEEALRQVLARQSP